MRGKSFGEKCFLFLFSAGRNIFKKTIDLIPAISLIVALETNRKRYLIMNIKEAEALTGITKQNIRFYEKKGLLSPHRNEENSYRDYSQKDVETLLQIKLLRKLDISIENIHKILQGADMNDMIRKQLDLLLEKQSDLDGTIKMCRFLLHSKKSLPDTRAALLKMEDLERKGGRFMAILNDYQKVVKAEAKRKFQFVPNTMALTSEEFTQELCTYGMEHNLNLVVTEEGMYPKFEIDGLEYEAHREFGRFGAIIVCQVTHPELLQEEYREIEKSGKGSLYRRIYRIYTITALPVCLFLFFAITRGQFIIALILTTYATIGFWFSFRNFRLK